MYVACYELNYAAFVADSRGEMAVVFCVLAWVVCQSLTRHAMPLTMFGMTCLHDACTRAQVHGQRELTSMLHAYNIYPDTKRCSRSEVQSATSSQEGLVCVPGQGDVRRAVVGQREDPHVEVASLRPTACPQEVRDAADSLQRRWQDQGRVIEVVEENV